MNDNSVQQEILLIFGTGFASELYSQKDPADHSKIFRAHDQLKDACWNGLVKEMIPEIFLKEVPGKKLYLWQVREANQFLALEMSEFPMGVDKLLSIDPYRFLELQDFN